MDTRYVLVELEIQSYDAHKAIERTHQASAHTLCFTFAALALYQEEQDILYQHIQSILPGGRTPVIISHSVDLSHLYNMI